MKRKKRQVPGSNSEIYDTWTQSRGKKENKRKEEGTANKIFYERDDDHDELILDKENL